jgi:hypothetical protein
VAQSMSCSSRYDRGTVEFLRRPDWPRSLRLRGKISGHEALCEMGRREAGLCCGVSGA